MGRPSAARIPPLVPSIRNCGRPSSRGSQPMPAFCVRPKTSPLGRSSSISAVSGRRPDGPAPAVCTSNAARSDSTKTWNAVAFMSARVPLQRRSLAQVLHPPRMMGGLAVLERYFEIRRTTERLCEPLALEDYVVQAMPDASPAKWHLAHVSWFFEKFVLRQDREYRPLDERYAVVL